ncbi:hypothetical protein QTP88_001003 [Uroleucon formosanum]
MNIDETKKRKGGAEKQRDKKAKLLNKEAKKCGNVRDMFIKKINHNMLMNENVLDESVTLKNPTLSMMNPNTSTNKLQCEQTSIKLICSAETKLDDDEETIVDFPDIDEPEKINPNTNKLECGQTSIKLICSTETKLDDNTIVDFENATN